MIPKYYRIGFALGIAAYVLHQLARLIIITAAVWIAAHFIIKFW